MSAVIAANVNVVVVVLHYFILIRLLYLAYSAVTSKYGSPSFTSLPKDGGASCFRRSSGRSPIQFLTVHSHA